MMPAVGSSAVVPSRHHASRRFLLGLALIAFAALAGRVVYVLAVTRDDRHVYDATYYELQARTIAHGQGFFDDPFLLAGPHPQHQPAADHPPLTVFALLPAAFVEGSEASQISMRLTMVLVGTASVVLIGLLGRRLGGDTVGLVAAGIAALDPNLWMNDGLIMSEALAVLITVGLLWFAYRVISDGVTWPRTIALGALSAIGILARAEFVLFVPFLVLPALWVGTARAWRATLVRAAAACGVVLVLLAPWFAYNISRFERFTTLSTNDGLALRSANCDNTFYGGNTGSINVFPPCTQARDGREQSVWNAANRHDALAYIKDHLGRVPVVAVARLGRAWDVYSLNESLARGEGEGRPRWASWAGFVTTWVIVLLAVAGGVLARRRRVRIWPLVVPIVTTSLALALWAGGIPRYRVPVEPSLVILAAVAIAACFGRLSPGAASRDETELPGGDEPDERSPAPSEETASA
jgi:4-amino-4-deoxy-L-arabinose transferase-like glycosyltransferase